VTPLNGTTKKTLLRAACAAALIAVLAGLLPAPALAQDGGTGSLPAANCVVRPGTSNVNVRYGPGTDTFGVIGVLYAGQQLPVIGQNAAGRRAGSRGRRSARRARRAAACRCWTSRATRRRSRS